RASDRRRDAGVEQPPHVAREPRLAGRTERRGGGKQLRERGLLVREDTHGERRWRAALALGGHPERLPGERQRIEAAELPLGGVGIATHQIATGEQERELRAGVAGQQRTLQVSAGALL